MPQETPSIHSTRILRAYRLNNVETVKLNNDVTVLDKAKQRELRIANQDIRLINRTLDYINSSSGQSPEGRPPNYVDRSKRAESAPLFMYGERVASRRSKKRFRRVQSAHVGTSSIQRDNVDETGSQVSDETSSSTNGGKQRPKSSPPKALSYISNGYETDTLMSTNNQDKSEDNLDVSNVPPVNPYLTQISEEDAEVNDLRLKLNETSLPTEPTKLNRPKSRRRGLLHGRTHEMTKKVNEARVQMMNAKKKKPESKQAWTAASAQTKQEEVLTLKKSLQGERQGVINTRIQDFMNLYPLKKY